MVRTWWMKALRRHVAAQRRDRFREAGPSGDTRTATLDSETLSRRKFLAGAAALGMVGPTPAHPASRVQSVAIVGGGLAGLTAALTLADAGVASTLYEASTRLGGRVRSRRGWRDRQVSEWGGEFIDSDQTTVLGLVRRFGLSVVDVTAAEPPGSEDTYFFSGAYDLPDALARDFEPVATAITTDARAAGYPTTFAIQTPAGVALDSMSVDDWIQTRVPGGRASALGRLLELVFVTEFGAETTDQSALNLVYGLAGSASPVTLSDERYRIAGGNDLLPLAIRHTLRSVRFGWKMLALTRLSDGRVALTFDVFGSTRTVRADHVILALPFAVLRMLEYRGAGFDMLKQRAIVELGRGHNAKLALQFQTRYWNQPGPWPGVANGIAYGDTGFQSTWDASIGQRGRSGLLVGFTGGAAADALKTSVPYSDSMRHPDVIGAARTLLNQLEPVWPGFGGEWTGVAALSVPALDPNIRCSYAYYRVGQYHSFGGSERLHQENVHFAGEHCSQDFQGLMEGAAAEGVRAAEEILADLGRR